jgi:hypothetical protein
VSPDAQPTASLDDPSMPRATRLWIEFQIGDDGPSGTARDELGRSRSFTGWLELIALIEGGDTARPTSDDRSEPADGQIGHPQT